jgi:hypothetical protein
MGKITMNQFILGVYQMCIKKIYIYIYVSYFWTTSLLVHKQGEMNYTKKWGYNLSDIRLIVTLACETGAHADECFVSVWTVAEN